MLSSLVTSKDLEFEIESAWIDYRNALKYCRDNKETWTRAHLAFERITLLNNLLREHLIKEGIITFK